MHSFGIFTIGICLGFLGGAIFNALAYDKGNKEGYDSGYEDSTRLWSQMMETYINYNNIDIKEKSNE